MGSNDLGIVGAPYGKRVGSSSPSEGSAKNSVQAAAGLLQLYDVLVAVTRKPAPT
jgi:hypothetical protein